MSNSCIIEWFERLLFGGSDDTPPPELNPLILQLEADDIPWSHIILEGGGLTHFAYSVHGDLNTLIDFLENVWIDQRQASPPTFQTRAVSKFWDQLQLLLAKQLENKPIPLNPSTQDNDILKEILESKTPHSFHYESAEFWGELARKFIHLQRPETVSPLPPVSSHFLKRVLQLYDMTCQSRGQYFNPFHMHLIPDSEYINAAHWQTDENLEAFMHDQPTHPLTVAIQRLLKKSVKDLLNGEKSSALLDPLEPLDALLHNINKIHQSIQQVPHTNTPPKLIDIFQRLLALCHQDGLWEKHVPDMGFNPTSLSLLYLTEQLRISEREKKFLWKQVIDLENNETKSSKHIYPKDAKNKSCHLE